MCALSSVGWPFRLKLFHGTYVTTTWPCSSSSAIRYQRNSRLGSIRASSTIREHVSNGRSWPRPVENVKVLGLRVSLYLSQRAAKPTQRDLGGAFLELRVLPHFHTASARSRLVLRSSSSRAKSRSFSAKKRDPRQNRASKWNRSL
jgi:hypothetical protein